VLIAEDLLLLLVDDRTGRFLVDSIRLDNVLAGAVLVELVTIERVGFASAGGLLKHGRMVVLEDPTPLGDPVLGALTTVAASRPAKPEQLIAKLRKRLRTTLRELLSAAGALHRSTRKVTGIVPRTSWQSVDSSRE
jgi:hypothetical protein